MKDWKGNGKSTYVTIGASNHSDGEREKHDFYATSPEAVDALDICDTWYAFSEAGWEKHKNDEIL